MPAQSSAIRSVSAAFRSDPKRYSMIPQLAYGSSVARRQPRPFVLTLIIPLFVAASGAAQPTSPAGPASSPNSPPVYTLEECLALGRAQQPTLAAAQASLAAAQTAERGLNQIKFGALLARDLPARRQQAEHGVAAAAANLCQVQRDVDCSIARMFYSVIYAREQKKVTVQIVNLLSAVEKNGRTMLGQKEAPPDLMEKAHLYLLKVQGRDAEADAGLQRATAGLREAMGLCADSPFTVAEAKLPEPLPGVNKQQIISLASSMRGEIAQSENAAAISALEIEAQQKSRFVKRPTAAAGSPAALSARITSLARLGSTFPRCSSARTPRASSAPTTWRPGTRQPPTRPAT